MGNPVGIALFSCMASPIAIDSKWKVLALAGAVSAVVILGSIGIVRHSNRGRQVTPAILDASRALLAIPGSALSEVIDDSTFMVRRDEFARQLAEGALPVDSVRAFYQSYSVWMRDGKWDPADLIALSAFLSTTSIP